MTGFKKALPASERRFVILAAGIVIAAVIIAAGIIIAFSHSPGDGSNSPDAQDKWPANSHTGGFPQPEGEVYSVLVTESSTAVFLRGATPASADAYCSALTSRGLSLTGANYPKTGELDGVFITVAFDGGEGLMSVTFSDRAETSHN